MALQSGVPSSPTHFLELHVKLVAASLSSIAAAFKSGYNHPSSLRRRYSREARDGCGKVAHDVTYSQRTVVEKDFGQVMLSQQSWRNSTSRVKVRRYDMVIQLGKSVLSASSRTILKI
jgi:hypothetical protein